MTHDEDSGSARVPTPRAFDLTVEPWLPVQLVDGGEKELSLRDVFEHAGQIRRLSGDVPTQDFALTRLLLAICHDALDGPEDVEGWGALWNSEHPFACVSAYLDRYRDRFDLLSPIAPFFQAPGLRTAKNEVFALNRIVADVPNGEPFFTVRFPGVERVSFAEAARWVVHAHAYDTSGIKSGVVGDDRAKGGKAYPLGLGWAGYLGGVLAEGRTFRETLLLNLLATEQFGGDSEEDAPAWRRPASQPGPDPFRKRHPHPTGPRDLYTWQSRRLLVHADDDCVHGVVLTYGDPLAPQNMHNHEPMTGWRPSAPQEKKLGRPLVYMPREHDPARAAWRGLAALIAPEIEGGSTRGEPASLLRPRVVDWVAQLCNEGVLPGGMLVRVHTYGITYGTQQSVIDEVVDDTVDMRLVLLDETRRELGQAAISAVTDADGAVRALGTLAADLAIVAAHNDKRRVQGTDRSLADIARDTASDRAYAQLNGSFRSWLAGIEETDDPGQLRTGWQLTVREQVSWQARNLLDAAGEAAWSGRVFEEAKGAKTWRNDSSAERRFWFLMRRALQLAFPEAPRQQGQTEQADPNAGTDSETQEAQEQ